MGSIDAVVVGSGAAGGLAALLLTEAGLRVLVLEAGPSTGKPSTSRSLTSKALHFLAGPTPAPLIPLSRAALRTVGRWRQPIQSRCRQWVHAPEAFVDDIDCPYTTAPGRPFVWIRARGLGGRMMITGHGWQYYRLGFHDFSPADGWPFERDELDRWYAAVERRLELTGGHDGLPRLPDSELAHSLEPTANQCALQRAIAARWPSAKSVVGRFAPPLKALEDAAKTGRLTVRSGAIARKILVDSSERTTGIISIDQHTGATEQVNTPLAFVCASTLESTRLLMLSQIGTTSNALGHYLMDHMMITLKGLASQLLPDADREPGRCLYLPRFDARNLSEPVRERGFGVQVYQTPLPAAFSLFGAISFGEMRPRRENQVILDTRVDAWGIPILRVDCGYNQADQFHAEDQADALRELAETAHLKFFSISKPAPPGSAIHECGTARMGADPSDSVLDQYNQVWDARGTYVTDGASFCSLGAHNPTLTILALTARAVDHAIRNTR